MEKASVCDQSLNWKQAFSSPSLGNQWEEAAREKTNGDAHLGMECCGLYVCVCVQGRHVRGSGDLGEPRGEGEGWYKNMEWSKAVVGD